MASKLAAAFEQGDSDEDYGDDEFEEGAVAQVQAAAKGKSILAQAAAQVQAETRVEAQSAMKSEADVMAVQNQQKSERGAMALDVMKSALADSSDEDDGNGDPMLDTALRVACWHGELNKATGLCDKGANPRARDRHGWTALHWACKGGDSACVDVLVEAVKDQKGKVPAFLNAADSLSGWTAMHVACINARKDAVKALLAHGAAADKKDGVGETAAECIPHSARNAKHLRRLLGVAEPGQGSESKEGDGEDKRRREDKDKDKDDDKASREEKQ